MQNGKETQHFFPGNKPHICHSPTLANGEMMETRVPLLLIVPSSLWNIDNLLIDKTKEALSNVPSKSWIGQTHCGVSRQYLKEWDNRHCAQAAGGIKVNGLVRCRDT